MSLCVTIDTSSSPLSFAPSDTTPPSTMAVLSPHAHDDGLSPRSDVGRPPRGHDQKSYPPCPYCGKKNHPTNKCWKQFGKLPTAQVVVTPSATLSPASLSIHTSHYHVTLISSKYDTLRCSGSIDASSSASLASLQAPSTSGTFIHLTSSSSL